MITDRVQQAVLKGHKDHSLPPFSSGDTITVAVRVKEGEKERVQQFKGVVLKIQGSGTSKTFTVRKVSEGVGVERTFPFTSPFIDKVEVLAYGMIRRSRLFYLRDRKGRAAKVKSELAVIREQRTKNANKSKAVAGKAKSKNSPVEDKAKAAAKGSEDASSKDPS